MIFALRALFVSLAFFAVSYCTVSLLVVCAWHIWKRVSRGPTVECSGLLFALRVSPLLVSISGTLFLALPAFLRLESSFIDEDLGTLAFSVAALLIAAAGLTRVLSARQRSLRVVSEWMQGAVKLDAPGTTQIMQIRTGLPPLVLVGVIRPTMLISETAISSLNDDELGVAIGHELGHVGSRDNLKKLIVHGMPFPGMKDLETAWQEAAELNADTTAVSNCQEAVQLAAALIKLSQLTPLEGPLLAAGLVNRSGLVRARVERLLAWSETSSGASTTHVYFLVPLTLVLLYALANYHVVLQLTHWLTESFIG